MLLTIGQCTGHPPNRKNDPVPNINSAEIEIPALKYSTPLICPDILKLTLIKDPC